MLSLDECIALSGLTRENVDAIAPYEHCSEVNSAVKYTPRRTAAQAPPLQLAPSSW
jgi:hypothetical protein